MKLNTKTIIYVVCPPNFKTGGTELAHQLDTPLFVEGEGAEKFFECRDQTEIPKTIARLMGGEL